MDPPRRAAYDVLHAVAERDAFANLVLPTLLRERAIEGRDAAFATELAYGTLRSVGTYDLILEAASTRPLAQVDRPLLDVLRLGVHQLLALRVPAHAAVATAVDLAREVAGERAVGFGNAVLRKVASRDYDGWTNALAPAYDEDPIGHISFVHAHPRWIVEAYADALDRDLDETAEACRVGNVAPVVHLAARPGRSTQAELLAELGAAAQPGPWSPYAVHLVGGGDPAQLAAIRTGRAGVQDEGSQLAALALAGADLDGTDRRWLDLCAGPGGKAALLAGLAAERGSTLLAVDRAVHRAGLAATALGRTPGTQVIAADGTHPAWRSAVFERVLVDAPCTGLGALRRRPEARWRRRPEDALRLQTVQVQLLRRGLDAVRPGGIVVYVTCSPHPAETLGVVDQVSQDPAVEVVHTPSLFPGLTHGSGGNHVQLWPHRHGTDAMFISVFRRARGRQ